jgi:hypothetical protein
MAHQSEAKDAQASETETAVGLRAHSTSPHRTVFTEPKNSDGWISTDLTVEVRR